MSNEASNLPRLSELGVTVASLLVRAGFAKSNSEARRQILGGSVQIGDIKIQDAFARFIVFPEQNKFGIIERSS